MKFDFKRLFSKEILERGRNYYAEDRVSNLLKKGNTITASVQGNHRYKLTINTKNHAYRCNCPYEGQMCKHLAAVFYAINNRKNIPTAENIEKNLAKKSKEELIRIMQEMLAQEPKFNALLLSKEKQILKKIEEIDSNDDEENWAEFYDYIPDRVEDILDEIKCLQNKQELLLALLKKAQELNEQYDHHGSTEDSVFSVLDELNDEKKRLPKKDAQKIEECAKKILGDEYDSFTQEE